MTKYFTDTHPINAYFIHPKNYIMPLLDVDVQFSEKKSCLCLGWILIAFKMF